MEILLVHNSYLHAGGEDEVVNAEHELLATMGHRVRLYHRSNEEIRRNGGLGPAKLAVRAVWASDSIRDLERLTQTWRPAVVHFHNTFPLISPGAYQAARSRGIAVVQTLHNYRLVCANAHLYRSGRPCEDCVGKRLGWPGILYGCYRGSRLASGVVAGGTTVHRLLGTWERAVDVYIAPTHFAASKFVQGGLPASKIVVKPHFVHPDPGGGNHSGGYALYVGRLSPEKGVDTLLAAWLRLNGRIPLRIVGDGPLAPRVGSAARQMRGVEWLGRMTKAEVFELMQEATLVVVPSLIYETFGLVISEAFAAGTPAVVSGHGALRELVEPGRTGLAFEPGDPDDLAAKVEWMWSHADALADMRRQARREYEARFTATRNYQMLMGIYDLAMSRGRH